MKIIRKATKLWCLLAQSAFDGHVLVLAGSGMLTLSLAPIHAFSLMAGPGALITAATLEGQLREKVLSVLLAGSLATICVLAVAILGTTFTTFLNFFVLKVAGGLAVITIGLLLMGLEVPQKLPLLLMLGGILLSFILK